MKVCAVEGCERPGVIAKGLCWKHYQRQRLTGKVENERMDNPSYTRPCAVAGCERLVGNGARGWCRKHYQTWRQYGDPEAPDRRGDGTKTNRRCEIEGCDRLMVSHGLCGMHIRRLKRGLPLDVGNLGRRQYTRSTADCSVEGCSHLVYARGLCRIHYERDAYAKRRERQTAASHSIRP